MTERASVHSASAGEARHFIANQWTEAGRGETLEVIDPSDGEPFAAIARGRAPDMDAAVHAARTAIGASRDGPWARVGPADRARILMRIARTIDAHRDELAAIEARDTGKPLNTARVDAEVLVRYFEFYAGACDKFHGETLPYREGFTVLTLREPLGVTAHIIPWNYPMQVCGRSVAASLAAGNACVIKPAEDGSLSILKLASLVAEADVPAGIFNVVTGLGAEAGAALAMHRGIDHVSFTGSTLTGAAVATAAAQHHCPVVLELGGKSPQIVFDDADLDEALPVIVSAIVQNCGQTCSAGSRLLVQRGIYEDVMNLLAPRFEALQAGSSQMNLDMGPLINAKQHAHVRAHLAAAKGDGIGVAARGSIAANVPPRGFYQEAVLLRDVPPAHPLAQREIFGPVLAAMPFDDEQEALALANGTDYGLCAGVWTRNGARQLRLARKLRCGQVFINNYGAGGGVELPFGGVKSSGYGREKGFEALYALTSLKTIAIRHS